MTDEFGERMRKEFGEWKAKLDELKVKANLAKMEARDLVGDAETKLERFSDQLNSYVDTSAMKAESAREGVEAAWKSFKQAYREALKRYEDS
jgi:TPP-dependent trihydroxycyclohexane-1,2-dione (THcHDO) dehydratase